jgi:hypothetical protein
MISLLVPYRSDDGGARDTNWEWLAKYWANEMPEAEVVTGDDGSVPFNRAASINVAARKASGDVFVNIDADYWCHPQGIRDAASLVQDKYRAWALPYTRLCRLKRTVSASILAQAPSVAALPGSLRGGQYYHVGELPYCSAAIYSREAWNALGGMPECFKGWGGEDRAWACVLCTLWGLMYRLPGIMYHLWHPMLTPAGWAEVPAYPARHEGQTEFFEPLRKQFIAAEGKPSEMRALLNNQKVFTPTM